LAGTRAKSCDQCGSGTVHPGQVLGGSLPLLSPPLYLYTIKQYICQGNMFLPHKVIIRPSKKTDPRAKLCSLHCGIPQRTCCIYITLRDRKHQIMLNSTTLQVPAFGFKRHPHHASKGKEVSINKIV